MRDVRTPADPQDFESRLKRMPSTPADVRILDRVNRVLSIASGERPSERMTTTRYRVYFLAAAALGDSYKEGRNLQRAGVLLAEIPVRAGNVDTVWEDTTTAEAGGYVVTGVNSLGAESAPSVVRRIV